MSKLEENQLKINELEQEILSLDSQDPEFKIKTKELNKLKKETFSNLSHWDRVLIARSESRLKAPALVNKLFDNFIEFHGDQLFADDQSILSGLAFLDDIPVTVLAQAKGTNLTESLKRNFGMTSPEGFRKSLRLAREAEKFNRPIITIVDTSGAYPGKGAEERGQSRAIAENLMEFSKLRVPVIAIVLSEGGSGGALALTVSDYIFMFENAIYSVLSPEGFSSILFKNTKSAEESAEIMKLTSHDLKELKIIDEIIEEPLGGIKAPTDSFIKDLRKKLVNKINELSKLDKDTLVNNRYDKFRRIGLE